jgi:AcrR family transcriptional regulator
MIATKTIKSEQTKANILRTALRLFRERGYEETTMRVVADEAGVSLGNAYYYFKSKDELVHNFYEHLQTQALASCEGVLLVEKTLRGRLVGVIRAQLAVTLPYQGIFASLFRIAADPNNELNPFHEKTAAVRNSCIARFDQVLDGANEKVPADLRSELPYLFWLYHLGIVLFWIYDRSPGCVRTVRLLELSSELVVNLIKLATLPVLQPLRQSALSMLASLRGLNPAKEKNLET